MINATGQNTSYFGQNDPQGTAAQNQQAQQSVNQYQPPQQSNVGGSSNSGGSNRGKRSFFGVNLKSLGVVLGLVSFLVLTMAGVFVGLRIQDTEQTTAPTEPQAAQEQPLNCSLSFVAQPGEEVIECEKFAYGLTEDNGELNRPGLINVRRDTVPAGGFFIYKMDISSSYQQGEVLTLSDPLDENLNFVRSNCLEDRWNPDTRILECYPSTSQTGEAYIAMIVQVKETVPDGTVIPNTATVNTNPNRQGEVQATEDLTAECNVNITVTNDQETIACEKFAYEVTDENRELNRPGLISQRVETLQPGDQFIYKMDVSSNYQAGERVRVSDPLDERLTFVDSNCLDDRWDAETRTLSCVPAIIEGGTTYIAMLVEVNKDLSDGDVIPNTATVETIPANENSSATEELTAECSVDVTISETTVQTSPSPTPTNEPSPTPTDEPTPTPPSSPAPGCNEECASNADCGNPDHICVTVSGEDTKLCRLATNPESASCSEPRETTTTTTTNNTTTTNTVTNTQQPTQPEQLPQAGGFRETAQAIVAGTGAVILGVLAALLVI